MDLTTRVAGQHPVTLMISVANSHVSILLINVFPAFSSTDLLKLAQGNIAYCASLLCEHTFETLHWPKHAKLKQSKQTERADFVAVRFSLIPAPVARKTHLHLNPWLVEFNKLRHGKVKKTVGRALQNKVCSISVPKGCNHPSNALWMVKLKEAQAI